MHAGREGRGPAPGAPLSPARWCPPRAPAGPTCEGRQAGWEGTQSSFFFEAKKKSKQTRKCWAREAVACVGGERGCLRLASRTALRTVCGQRRALAATKSRAAKACQPLPPLSSPLPPAARKACGRGRAAPAAAQPALPGLPTERTPCPPCPLPAGAAPPSQSAAAAMPSSRPHALPFRPAPFRSAPLPAPEGGRIHRAAARTRSPPLRSPSAPAGGRTHRAAAWTRSLPLRSPSAPL